MQMNDFLKKMLVFGTIVLFFGAVVTPTISSVSIQSISNNIYTDTISFDPFKEGWKYRKKVTINHNKVAGNLVSFPVLVRTFDTDLRDKAQSDGDDILFMDDKGDANQLFHEIEYFDRSSGELVAWLNIPTLSSTIDVVFYMYYGNLQCASQEFPESVWDSNYLAVWHLDDNSDSTLYGYDLTVGGAPTVTTGKISNCYYFEGNDRLMQSTLLTTFPSECSYECWINIDDLGASNPYQIFMGSENDHSADQFKLYYDPSPNYIVGNAEHAGSGPIYVHSSPNSITENTWFFATYTYKANEAVKLYLNSIEYIADSTTGQIGNGNDYDFELASTRGGTKSFLTGWIDETRVSKVRRSSAWIETSYNTMNDPSNFLSFGPEEKPRQKAYETILSLWFLERFPMLERLLNILR